MAPVITALAEEHAELDRLLATLTEADWDRPSRCPGWTISDVVLHLAQSDEMALGSVHGRFGEVLARLSEGLDPATSVDDGADMMVARERGPAGPEVHERWRAGAAALREGLGGCEPGQRLEWVVGDMAARTLATTRLAETWIHAGDIAAGLDRSLTPTDRLWHIAHLAWRTLPFAFARAGREMTGPVAFHLRAPSGDSWTFAPDAEALTVVEGEAAELCLVAAQRTRADETDLQARGPDARAVLDLVRTYA